MSRVEISIVHDNRERRGNVDKIVYWFREVHTNSRVDVWQSDKGEVYLINEKKDHLKVNWSALAAIKSVVKTSKELAGNGCDLHWIENIKNKDFEGWEEQNNRLGETGWNEEDYIEFYRNIPLEKLNKTPGAWYIGDIKLITKTLRNGWKILNRIEVEIKDRPYENIDIDNYEEMFGNKCAWEEKLAVMYQRPKDNIAIPLYYGECRNEKYAKELIFMMLFELKSLCRFETMDDLTMIRNHIISEIYPNYIGGNNKRHILELSEGGNVILPQNIKTVFPSEMTVENIMKLMGIYYAGNSDEGARIIICHRNIEKTIISMTYREEFVRKFMEPIRIKYGYDKKRIVSHIVNILTEMVFVHECGHHVFRNLRGRLSVNERESLANWFTSMIIEDDYYYRLAQYLITFQIDIYQDFIKLPMLETLEETEYKEYCNKMHKLIRGREDV